MNKYFAGFASLIIVASAAYFVFGQQQPCANSISCAHDLTAKVENDEPAIFHGQQIQAPTIDLAAESSLETPSVLGEVDTDLPQDKHIYVDLNTQRLFAFDGDQLFMETLVSTGKWGRTPTGDFRIWIKLRSTKMSGGSGNDYYYLPNVPYVMFYYNDAVAKGRGFSLHGTYWHNNFGTEMSHGCVNLRTVDAEKLFNWVTPIAKGHTTYESADDPGTIVSVCNRIEFREGASPLCIE